MEFEGWRLCLSGLSLMSILVRDRLYQNQHTRVLTRSGTIGHVDHGKVCQVEQF